MEALISEQLRQAAFENNPQAHQRIESMLAQGLSADVLHHGLMTAIGHDRITAFHMLFPHCDPLFNDSEALYGACVSGNIEMINMLLPHSDAKARNSSALVAACVHNNEDLIDLLYPLSDPKAAKQELLREPLFHPYLKHIVVRMKAEDERRIIEQNLPNKPNHTKKKI